MASLSKVTVGERTEHDRILAEAGFDAEMLRALNRKPHLVKLWVEHVRELLTCNSMTFQSTKLGLSVKQIIADFEKAGWKVDARIPEILTRSGSGTFNSYRLVWGDEGVDIALTIQKGVIPEGCYWSACHARIGDAANAFDLEGLRNVVLGREVELLNKGVRHLVAPRTNITVMQVGYQSAYIYADLEQRRLEADFVDIQWGADTWFGSAETR